MNIIFKIIKGIVIFYAFIFVVSIIGDIIDSTKSSYDYNTSYSNAYTTNDYTYTSNQNYNYTDNTYSYTDNDYIYEDENYVYENSDSACTGSYSEDSIDYSVYNDYLAYNEYNSYSTNGYPTNTNYMEPIELMFYGAKTGNGDLILQCFPDVTWQILEYYGYDSGYFSMEPEENMAYTVTDVVHLTSNYSTFVQEDIQDFMNVSAIKDMYAVTVKVYPDSSFMLDYTYGTIYVGLIQGSWRIVNLL